MNLHYEAEPAIQKRKERGGFFLVLEAWKACLALIAIRCSLLFINLLEKKPCSSNSTFFVCCNLLGVVFYICISGLSRAISVLGDALRFLKINLGNSQHPLSFKCISRVEKDGCSIVTSALLYCTYVSWEHFYGQQWFFIIFILYSWHFAFWADHNIGNAYCWVSLLIVLFCHFMLAKAILLCKKTWLIQAYKEMIYGHE